MVLKHLALGLGCLTLAACMDAQQQVHVAPDGVTTLTVTAQIKREGWDMMTQSERDDLGCGEERVREMRGIAVRTLGRTTETEQRCLWEIVLLSIEDIPEGMPLVITSDGDLIEVTMAPFGDPQPIENDFQRMMMAGASWSLIVRGDIVETSGQMNEDGQSTYRIIPLVDAMSADPRPGIRASFRPIE